MGIDAEAMAQTVIAMMVTDVPAIITAVEMDTGANIAEVLIAVTVVVEIIPGAAATVVDHRLLTTNSTADLLKMLLNFHIPKHL